MKKRLALPCTIRCTALPCTIRCRALVLVVFLSVSSAFGAAFVNVATGTGDASAASISAAAANHTGGNLLSVFVDYDSDGTNQTRVTSCTDTAGNTYTRSHGVANATSNDAVEHWFAKNITGNAANVVTCNFSPNSAFRQIQVLQYSGLDTASPLDVSSTGTGTGTAASTANLNTTASGVIAAGMTSNATNTWTAGTNYTIRVAALGGDRSGSEDRITAASGNFPVTATGSASVNWSMLSVAFKDAGAGPSGPPHQLPTLGCCGVAALQMGNPAVPCTVRCRALLILADKPALPPHGAGHAPAGKH